MEIVVTAIVAVVLTAVVVTVARAGASRHQEDLNDHGATTATPRGSGEPARPEETPTDRPAGPDAEAMGVADAGEPSVDPSAERRS